jgi:hypothetical protein
MIGHKHSAIRQSAAHTALETDASTAVNHLLAGRHRHGLCQFS